MNLQQKVWIALLLLSVESALAAAGKSDDYCRSNGGASMADLSQPVTAQFLTRMKEIGATTIARYYDYPNETIRGKRLRPAEVELIKSHGLKLLVVFQHKNNRSETFIRWRERGAADAAEALSLAASFNQPAMSAVYFGVDGDFVSRSAPQRGFYNDEVKSYFKEVKRVFSSYPTRYRIGVYGSGRTCEILKVESLAEICWISHSHGFVGTKEILRTNGYNIEQLLPGRCGGREVDLNKFRQPNGDVGQFNPN